MLYRLTTSVTLCATLAGCGDAVSVSESQLNSPQAGGANVLSITTSKTTYGWEDVSYGGAGVVATVVNKSAVDYYANVGDAFNAAAEQTPVFIAMGTDAAVERLEGGSTWSDMPTGVLVEGSKVVVLKAGGRYELRGNISDPRKTGTMRIRLRYYTAPNAAGLAPMVDYSNTFTVR